MGQYLKLNITVPENYIEGFIRANNTFLYQLVFDPIRRQLVPLNAYSDDVDPETLLYAGKYPLLNEKISGVFLGPFLLGGLRIQS